MKKLVLIFSTFVVSISTLAQVTIEPRCFSDTDEIVITYDATKGASGLVGASKVYMHSGVITDSPTGTSWQYVIGNWAQDDGIGEMSKVEGQSNLWEITLTPRAYYNVPEATNIYRLAMVFRNADGSKEGKSDAGGDIFIDLATNPVSLQVQSAPPLLVNNGETISFEAVTCSNAVYTLYIDDIIETTVSGEDSFVYDYVVTQAEGSVVSGKLEATVGELTETYEFTYSVRLPAVDAPRPAGIIDGINYLADPSKVILSLWAPTKTSVYVVGDFNDWEVSAAYQMKRDAEHFWIELTGLTSGNEYAYQYWIDESIWIADPYADKILDPDDKWIPEATYPNLKEFPEKAMHGNWYFNRAAVFQTAQEPYVWQNTDFEKPKQENLVIYELLVRDFLGEDNMNYQALIDTLDYLENMGINAIELMPIMEFNGNDSWGYNPTFMLAVDKAYGTKNDLKEFIDECHGRGMAVILDMVMNQNDAPSPYAMMSFDFPAFKPTSTNLWFNRDAKHPFNVFFDINHESEYTKAWLDTVNHYWLNEFQFDGYRFDLSKGFTQKNSGDNVGLWGQKDDSRIAILKRMADEIWSHTPDAYVILEHFADNNEEKILSDYGMMLWGNMHYDYKEANLGYAAGKSIGSAYFENRGWNENAVVAYMESHDEERQFYEIPKYGASSGTYDIQEFSIGLQRLKLTATFFFTVPGPKLLWQFGEFGYDIPIDENGRTGRKPTKWEYLDDPLRNNVLKTYQELIGLREKYDVFTEGDFSWTPGGVFKSIHTTKADTNVTIVGNFDVIPVEGNPAFQHTGTWYDFFSGKEITVTDINATLYLNPGVFHIYTDKKLHEPESDIITSLEVENLLSGVSVYPNPTTGRLNINLPDHMDTRSCEWVVIDIFGKELMRGSSSIPNSLTLETGNLPIGLYSVEIMAGSTSFNARFIRE